MVKPREAFLGAITELDEDKGGVVNANNAIITNISATKHRGLAASPTAVDGYGQFWVYTTSPRNRPAFTCNDGTVFYLDAIGDHGALAGLGDDDHTQYLTVNGSRFMTGTLNMGTNNITNVGTVDGVDVSDHASRHINNGADVIDGDRLDISYISTNYTRTVDGVYTANYNQLTSHLYGIDLELKVLIDAIAAVNGVPTSRTITAGAGLTGGGNLATNIIFDVVAADGSITVNSDSIQVGVISDINHGSRGGGNLHAVATDSVAGFMSAADKAKSDAINLDGYAGSTHHLRHENGGADEINVVGLSGLLADPQTVSIQKNGTLVAAQSSVNFIEGSNVSLTISDDSGNNRVNVRISSTGGSGTSAGTLSQTLSNGNATDGYNLIINGGSYVSGSGTAISIYDGLNLNNYNITNVGTVDGYNLETKFSSITLTLNSLTAHASSTSNPHSTSIANLVGGTLAQLNTAITDADVPPTTRSIISGNGLAGGGDLSADRTLSIGAGDSSITINADSIQVGVISDTNHGTRGGGTLHPVATTSVAGFESAADKTKLDGIASGAEVNLNIWSIFSDGTTTASPATKSDTFRFRSANNILTTAVGSNDVTYGDNLLLTITQANIDHGSIGGLSDDDHTQYVLTNGNRTMTGSLNMGGYNITSVGTVDGYNLETKFAWLVTGPSSSTDNAIARFDSTTGKIIQNSSVTIDDSGNITTSGTVDGVDVSAHAARHISGAADEIDADKDDIDFVPLYYTRTTDSTYSTSTAHLSAHLKGLDLKLGTLTSDHGSLNGLSDDDHTQYLLIDGTRAMTGSLNMGSYSIGSCSSVGQSTTLTAYPSGHIDHYINGNMYESYHEQGVIDRHRSYTAFVYGDIVSNGVSKYTQNGRDMVLSRADGTGTVIYQTQLNYV
jgi:hypothetical protein